MKFANREVIDLIMFDEIGNMVANLNTLKESKFYQEPTSGREYVVVKDALLDESVLKFIGKVKESKTNEYDAALNNATNKNTVTISKKDGKPCKLIAKVVMRKADTGIDQEFMFEFPKAKIVNNFVFAGSTDYPEPTTFDLVFEIIPFNQNDDLYIIHY